MRQKGTPKTGGRKVGTPNKTTQSAREAFELAFQGLGGYQALLTWARQNETQFFNLYARLIPVAVSGPDGKSPMKTIVEHVHETVIASKP